jgi:lipoyl(octanoyl) transferase
MNWHFINTGLNRGKFNMDFDLNLLNECNNETAYLRLYRWNPYAISLGANQNFSSINLSAIAKENIELVYRPTGGRAVLHSEELTYSVVLPLREDSSAREIYKNINSALLKGLNYFDNRFSSAALESEGTHLPSFYKTGISEVCFAAPAKSEVKLAGKKIIGSAQRKIENKILQHGSILCGEFHKRIIDFLRITPEEKSILLKELDEKTIDIKSITGEEVNYDQLSLCILKGFEDQFAVKFIHSTKEELLYEQ